MSYYGEKAYRSDQLPDLPVGTSKPPTPAYSIRPLGDSWGRIPFALFRRVTPKALRDSEVNGYPPELAWMSNERYGAVNHRCIRPLSLTGESSFYLTAEVACKFLFFFLLFVHMFPTIWIAIADGLDETLKAIPYFLGITLIPAILWYVFRLINKLNPPEHGLGSPWELNRQTGMVTLYQYDQYDIDAEPTSQAVPFYEMDAYVSNTFDRYGAKHFLFLQHRYSKFLIPLGKLIGEQNDASYCEDLWDFIQDYMDVSKPLPDLPLLEPYRPLDPTTAAADKNTNRPARYWRDMTDSDWKKQYDNALTPRPREKPKPDFLSTFKGVYPAE